MMKMWQKLHVLCNLEHLKFETYILRLKSLKKSMPCTKSEKASTNQNQEQNKTQPNKMYKNHPKNQKTPKQHQQKNPNNGNNN